ncbi:MAG: FecR domain-containing protein [Chitinophagaceae bacterium]|nr:FecR domain-containing protein [Chitinophagaceae bacterium]
MTKEEAEALLKRYSAGSCTPEEKKAIEAWYAMLEKDSDWQWSEEEKQVYSSALRKNVFESISDEKGKTIGFNKRRVVWWSVAASVAVFAISAIVYKTINSHSPTNNDIKNIPVETKVVLHDDALPGKAGAMLTLDDGSTISLDSIDSKSLAVQGGARVSNEKGLLAYTATDNESDKAIYNTISTANGRQYAMVLSDGTKLWLNASSSVRYPVIFPAATRVIEMTGEAYFEVAARYDKTGKKNPFIVRIKHKNGTIEEVEVLGTHFNVNAYDEEPNTTVTLLEGAVRVGRQGVKPVSISPGQQAQIGKDIIVKNNADIEAATAWKDGRFVFRKAGIQAIMRQAARWYDIEVYYPQKIPSDILSGGFSKNVKLSEFLKILEYSEINATINDRRVDISPVEGDKR